MLQYSWVCRENTMRLFLCFIFTRLKPNFHHLFYISITSLSLCIAADSDVQDHAEDVQSDSRLKECTFLLLDKSKTEDYFEKDWFLRREVRDLNDSQLIHKTKKQPSEHYVLKRLGLKRKHLAEKMVDELLDEDHSEDKDTAGHKEEEPDEFIAGALLLPVGETKDFMLVCGFGHWYSLINEDAIVKDFGLRIACSVGVICEEQDKANERLEIIGEVHFENQRNPLEIGKRFRKALGTFADCCLDAEESKLEQIRFKPTSEWGSHLVTAKEYFKVQLDFGKDVFGKLFEMVKKLYNLYLSFTRETAYQPLLRYIDPPVQGALATRLSKHLFDNWQEHTENERIYPHYTYWVRFRNACRENKYVIYDYLQRRNIEESTIVRAESKYDEEPIEAPIQKLIRTMPISFEGKYYWFDRGEWYEISDSRTNAMYMELEQNKIDFQACYLPSYDKEHIEMQLSAKSKKQHEEEAEQTKGKQEYEELLYNKSATKHIEKKEDISWVSLMDRENIAWTTGQDKFELADLIFHTKNGDYTLVHVKRAHSHELEHACTQVERCVAFLGARLDRRALIKPFMLARLATHENLQDKKRSSRKYQEAFKSLPAKGYTKKSIKELSILKEPTQFNQIIKKWIDSVDFNIDSWNEHSDLFGCFIDRIADAQISPLDEKTLTDMAFLAQEGIKHAKFFSDDAPISKAKKKKIKVVLAIIDDDEHSFKLKSEENFHTNHILRMYQTRKELQEKGFAFMWTIIPKKTEVPPEDLSEYSYSAKDMNKLLMSIAKPFSINIRPQTDSKVQVLQKEAKGVFVLSAHDSTYINQTSEMYIIKSLAELLNTKSPNLPFTLIIPHKTSNNYWSFVTLVFEKQAVKIDLFVTYSNPKIKEELQKHIDKMQKLKGFNGVLKRIYRDSIPSPEVSFKTCQENPYSRYSVPMVIEWIKKQEHPYSTSDTALSNERADKLKMDHVGQDGAGLVTQFKKVGDRMIVCSNDTIPPKLQQLGTLKKQATLDSWLRPTSKKLPEKASLGSF